jgi:hypothetical protein
MRCGGALGLVGGHRRLNLVELLGVGLPDFVAHQFFAVRQATLNPGVHLFSIKRGWMREVGLKQNVVYANLVDQPVVAPAVQTNNKRKRCVTRELLGRQPIAFRMLGRHAITYKRRLLN